MEAVAPDHRLAGRYVLEELAARGGMATVWRALDQVLARPVAVKVLRDDLARDPNFFTRFKAEAVAAARLTHPCIISVFDTGVDDGVCYIVMEYFEGKTLRAILDERGSLESAEAVGVILPVLSALAFAHSMGIVHRDVKAANILAGRDGRVKVTDFGIAKAAFAAQNLTTTGAILGTVRYLSPEQAQGTAVDARSDLYSTGVLLYELLTGRPPFQAETDVATAMMRLTTDPLPPAAVRPGIPRGLNSAVMRALARRPDDRFQSAESMRAALDRYADPGERTVPHRFLQPGLTEPVRAVRPVAGRGAFRSWMLVPLLVIAVAAAVIGGGLALGRLKLGGPLGVQPVSKGTSPNAGQAAALSIAGAKSFDPQGDGSEHPESVSLAIDGNPATAWTTDHYSSPTFGNLKDGVGLWLDLGGTRRVARIVVSSSIHGWSFELKAGALDHLSAPIASTNGATTFTLGSSGSATIDLRPVQAPGILIWITQLAPADGRYAASISDVRVVGATG